MSEYDGTRLIRVSEDLLSLMGTRTEDGRKLTYEWGEPVTWADALGNEPVYEPLITATDDGSRYCGCPK